MKNYGFVKCAIANFNGKIGNPAENAKKIKAQILTAEERHAKILVFP